MEEQDNKGQDNKGPDWPAVTQTVAAYLAAPVVLLYPFGFAALFLQFTRYFALDGYTALHAVALISRTIVIGQGATILVVALVGSVLLSGLIGRILLWQDWPDEHPVWSWFKRGYGLALVSATALVLYVLYSRILAAGRVSWLAILGRKTTRECREDALRHQLNLWPDSLIPAIIFVSGTLLGGADIQVLPQVHSNTVGI